MGLQNTIIQESTQLFRTQGFAATTMRQISSAAGCTNAALYYYFPDGKRQILQAVIRHRAEEINHSLQFPDADSLESLLNQLYRRLGDRMSQMSHHVNWLMVEFDTLPEKERELIQDYMINFQKELQNQIGRFVLNTAKARQLAWLIHCAFFGYRQLFLNLAIGEREELSVTEFGEVLTTMINKTEN